MSLSLERTADSVILASQGRSPGFPFQTAGILIALHVFMLVFLPVVCLLLSLVLLWHLDWFPVRPSSLRGGAKRPTLHRLHKPHTPDDCPACRLVSPPSSGGGPTPQPVRPWCEVKSRRGAPKRRDTQGFACPNRACLYCSNTDAHMHAAFWRWQVWPDRADPDLSRSCVPHDVQCPAQHAVVPVENPFSADRNGPVCAG